MIYLGLAISLCYFFQSFSFSFKSLNPFTTPIIEQVVSKEYPCSPTATITIDSAGSLEVNTWKHPRVMIQARKSGTSDEVRATSMNAVHDPEQISISTLYTHNYKAQMHYTLMIPEQATLKATMSGTITVLNSYAPVYLNSDNGNVKIFHAQSSVHARARQGKVSIKQRLLPMHCSLFVDAYYNIKLALSRNQNATIHAKAPHGIVTCDLFVTIEPIITKINKETFNRLMRDIKLTLGDGGPSISLESSQGSVKIIEY